MTEITQSAGLEALTLKGVCAGYGGKAVLNGLSLGVSAGEIYALLGGNGAGKSTTLKVLLGFLKPQSGDVVVAGEDIIADPAKARSRIAYVPENVALYEHLNARENLAYLLTLAGVDPERGRIEEALDAVGLDPAARKKHLSGYSKGMRQKVAIALAVARDVPVLLLDEPTSGLDPLAISEFHNLLDVLRGKGTAILMVTHDLLGATQVADRIGFLKLGRMITVEQKSDMTGFDINALYLAYQSVEVQAA
ncbi:putative ABC transporter ATP-binding protein NosF (plasmid) [Asticcacaulis sp. MM231]|uniref:ABC transporter ATP-binding protein n=1 Tax=Asticcacaulis sp. MM231 TaxID=3157666 RepID=UPI0032D58C70